MKKYTLLFIGFALVLGAFSLQSCKKEKDTVAKIFVRDVNNELVPGVVVRLYGKSSEVGKQGKVNVSDTATTNAAGEAIFNLNYLYKKGQAGVAVLDINARQDLRTGDGIIKIVEEETSVETVFIQ